MIKNNEQLEDPLDFDIIPIIFGKKGDTKYFNIIQSDGQFNFEVKSNWNPYDWYFENWHRGDLIGERFIVFGTWPGQRDTNSFMQIDRETGEIIFLEATDRKPNGWYNAICDKIEFDELPKKIVKQKF